MPPPQRQPTSSNSWHGRTTRMLLTPFRATLAGHPAPGALAGSAEAPLELSHSQLSTPPSSSLTPLQVSPCRLDPNKLLPQTTVTPFPRETWDTSGEGKGNPLKYACLGNPTDRGAWRATVHGVAKSQTRLSDFTSLLMIAQWSKY